MTFLKDNPYRPVWESMENLKPKPRHPGKIIKADYSDFREKVLSRDPSFADKIVRSFYQGDVYVLKHAFAARRMADLKNTVRDYGRKIPGSFHKIIEGCPDFHRGIDENLAKNYKVKMVKHSYYFFPWNGDPLGLFSLTRELWGTLKFLGGFKYEEYERNTPKDGIVDRLQVIHYPSGAGMGEIHSDPYLYQRLFISVIMSRRGKDYQSGGIYLVDENNAHVDLEPELEPGDVYAGYGTLLHGIDVVDKGRAVNWNSPQGR